VVRLEAVQQVLVVRRNCEVVSVVPQPRVPTELVVLSAVMVEQAALELQLRRAVLVERFPSFRAVLEPTTKAVPGLLGLSHLPRLLVLLDWPLLQAVLQVPSPSRLAPAVIASTPEYWAGQQEVSPCLLE